MFKNYTVETKVVRKKANDIEEILEAPVPTVDYTEIARETADRLHVTTLDLAKKITIGVLAYVAADTLRQVIVKSTKSR